MRIALKEESMSTMPLARPKIITIDWEKIINSQDIYHLPNDIAWSVMPPLLKPRYCGCAFVINGRIWVIGGTCENGMDADMEIYDPATGAWTMKPNPFSGSGQVFAAVKAGKIFAFGGTPVGMHMPTTVEMYDTVTGTVSRMPDMPVGCWHPGVASTLTGKIYILGGYIVPATTIDLVQEYNTLTNSWALRRTMSTKRYDLAAVTGCDGKIYTMGGAVHSDPDDLAVLEVYNPITNSWASRTPMPTPRRGLAAVSAGDRIYAVGGLHSCASLGIIEEYDPARNTWKARAPLPTGRWYLAGAALGKSIYAIGGYARTGEYLPGNPNMTVLGTVEKGIPG